MHVTQTFECDLLEGLQLPKFTPAAHLQASVLEPIVTGSHSKIIKKLDQHITPRVMVVSSPCKLHRSSRANVPKYFGISQ